MPDYANSNCTYPDPAVEVLDDVAVQQEAELVVRDERTSVHLHLALLQQQLHLQVTREAQPILIESVCVCANMRGDCRYRD